MGFASLDKLIVPAYYRPNDLFFSGIAKELWLIGGRNSIKSTDAAYLTAIGVMSNPHVNAMVLRQNGTDLATSVYPNLKQCIEWLDELWPEQRLSYRWHFRANCREMIFDGNRSIIFHGLDDPTKRKSEKPPLGGYFGYLWCEEFNQFNLKDVKSLRKSVLRGGPIGQSIYTYNPPMSKSEWVNVEAAKPKIGKYVFKTSYLDVLPYHPEWLGETFIQEAEEQRINDPDGWRHELLGEAIGTGGEIFSNYEVGEITDEQIEYFRSHGMARRGLDFGFTTDKTAYVESAYDEANETIYVYLSRGEHGLFEEDICDRILEPCGAMDKTVIADRAEPKAIARLQRLGATIRPCWKDPSGWKEEGMKFLRSKRRRIIIDNRPHRAAGFYDEISNYEYERYRGGDLHTDYPSHPKKGDHFLDAWRYGHDLDIQKHYTPKQWSLPKGMKRRY